MDGQVRIDNITTDRARLFYLLAILLAVLATRPFVGIEHDAFLYAAQALNRLEGVDLSEDIFFKFGNQDQFSPFTRIFSPAIALFGLQGATIGFLIAGLFLWVISAWVFARALFRDHRLAWVGLFCALIVNARYGSLQLSYAENFVSPRLFAEAFVLLGLARVFNRNWVSALTFLLIAGATHPLVGLTGWIIAAWLWLQDWRKFLALSVAGLGLGAALAVMGVSPFTWLFERLDPEWMTLLRNRDAIVLAAQWDWVATSLVLLPLFAFIYMGTHHISAEAKGSILQISIAVGLCLLASIIFVDVLSNRLMTGLQLWRALFLLHLVGNLCAAPACLMGSPTGDSRTFIRICLIMNMVETQLGALPLTSALMGLCAIIAFRQEGRGGSTRLLRWALATLAIIAVMQFFAIQLTLLITDGQDGLPEIGLQIAILLVLLFVIFRGKPAELSIAVLVGLVIGALALVLVIDDRSSWRTYAESSEPLPSAIREDLQGQNVYWEKGLSILWFKARMPSYYSCRQKGGSVFFKEQLVEFERRAAGLRGLNAADFLPLQESECPVRPEKGADGPTSIAQLEQACAALPDLDVMVLRAAFEGASRHELIVPARFPPSRFGQRQNRQMDRPNQTPMYFYFCEDLR